MRTSPSHVASRWSELGWPFVVVGLAGSFLVGISAPALVAGEHTWWFRSAFSGNKTANYLLLYVGLLCAIAAWIGVGRRLNQQTETRPGDLIAILIVWSLPLVLAPPIFSDDVYSYLAQGTLLHLGVNPYHVAPAALSHLHHVALANAVSPFWRHSTSPYGPLFIGAMSLVAGMTSSIELGVIVARIIELLGGVALAVAIPRIARACGADPARALWLCVLSPLMLFGLIAPGHNDTLMIGLMALSIAAALEHRPLLGITLCMLASGIKAPAVVAAVVILICWLRSDGTQIARWGRGATALCVAACTLLAASFATGLGLAWLSPSVLATPGRVHLAITPVSEIAWIVHASAASVSIHSAQSVIGKVAFALAAALGIWMMWRVRDASLARTAGAILLIFAALGPAAWPWYFSWGIPLVACDPRLQQSKSFIIAVVVGALVIKPNGILALPYGAAPFVLCVYVGVGMTLACQVRRRNRIAAETPSGRPATNTST